jgi:hypothetical protein
VFLRLGIGDNDFIRFSQLHILDPRARSLGLVVGKEGEPWTPADIDAGTIGLRPERKHEIAEYTTKAPKPNRGKPAVQQDPACTGPRFLRRLISLNFQLLPRACIANASGFQDRSSDLA